MFILLVFSFLAGIVTILSPCILPLLPIILAGGTGNNRRRPLGIVLGFVLSFTLATLGLSALVKATGISANLLRNLAILILFVFGLFSTFPSLKNIWERLTAKFASIRTPTHPGFLGGILIGVSLGIVWTPCVGPILASIITLAASSSLSFGSIFITLAYSLGTAIPLFFIMQGSSIFITRLAWLKKNSARIQQSFGLLMIFTSLLLLFQVDRRFQAYILDKFPKWGTGLTKFEDTELVRTNLINLNTKGETMNLKNHGSAPEITPGLNWLNSPPLTLQEQRGKVVLLDFWTYSCVNCIRTIPFLKAWDAKYKDQGLVIIGVHSPEFEFEKDPKNVSAAIRDFGVPYPVVQDNDFTVWRAYNNRYWPAKYLIDKEGIIRYTHFGEGDYQETELAIQSLLDSAEVEKNLVDLPEHTNSTRSPETYLGYWRLANFVSSPAPIKDKLVSYQTDSTFGTNGVGLRGNWLIAYQHAEAESGSSLVYRFDAKEVNLVMRPKPGITPKVIIYLDEEKLSELTITTDKLYNLINLASPGNHYLEIKFPEGGVEVYAFTFG